MHALLLPTRGLLAPAGRLAAVAAAAAARAHASARRQLQQHAVWSSWVPHASQPARAASSARAQTGSVRAAASAPGAAAEAGQRPRRTSKRAAAQQQHRQRQQQHQQQRPQRQQQQAPAPSPRAGAEDAFYAEAAASFEELGVAPALVSALSAAGFARPSRVQELVIPEILSGRDVVLAAETGSGKTLAYVAPMASLLLAKAAAGQQAAPASMLSATTSSSSSRPAAGSAAAAPQQRLLGLVLCPNSALCQQVVRLVGSLFAPPEGDSTAGPLLRAAHISSANPPPFDPPDIVVATPGALVTLFNDRGFSYGSQWTAEGVAARAAFVVLDEADLLCQGGYVKDVMRLLDAFKAGERRLIEAQVCAETGLDREAFSRLPRLVKIAAWEGGTPAMRKAGWRPRKAATASSSTPQEDGDAADAAPASPDAATSTSSSSSTSSNAEPEEQQPQQSYGPYFHRRYLFVAATMPALTKGDVGVELQKRFKDAVWVSGDMLHQIKPNVTHTWVSIGRAAGSAPAATGAGPRAAARVPADDTAVADECLLAAITQDPDYQAGAARVLVFTRNTASADRVAAMLEGAGVPNWLYHKNMPPTDQAAALAAMAQQHDGAGSSSSGDAGEDAAGNRVLVSTDAAARGIDLPGVTHVVQADFAANAIEFLHRVGRTARAGRGGKVTSLYGRADSVLAEALQRYIKEGRPVEECFSRNRSFSRKVKRYGGFVPRGQEGPQPRSGDDE